MRRVVVADRLATLLDIGLIVESELGIASGGRAPDWVALTGLAVSRHNVVESFQKVRRKQAPREVLVSAKLVKGPATS